jgi:hypothetical protein
VTFAKTHPRRGDAAVIETHKYSQANFSDGKRSVAKTKFIALALKQFCFAWIRVSTAASCALALGCHRSQHYDVVASVFRVEGNAVLLQGKSKSEQMLSRTSRLGRGDKIETSENGMVALSLIPGIFAQVQPRTIFQVEELRLSKDGNEMANAIKGRWAVIGLERGAIRCLLPKRGTGRCQLKVNTGLGTLETGRNTLFSLQCDGGSAEVVCIQGKVVWRSKTSDSRIPIKAGYYLKVTQGSTKQSEPIFKDAAVEEEVDATIGTAGALEELAVQERNAIAPWRQH